MDHFACFECDAQLGGQRYVMREDRPYCVTCFHVIFADYCVGCHQPIRIDEAHVTHDGRHWHASERCFACVTCSKTLLGKPFLPRTGYLFCSLDCCVTTSEAVDSGFCEERKRSQSATRTPNRRPPPRLQLDTDSEDENVYESVASFRNGYAPPCSSRSYKQDRMVASVMSRDLGQISPVIHPSVARRRHRSLSDLSPPELLVPVASSSPRGAVATPPSSRRRRGSTSRSVSEKSYAKACANSVIGKLTAEEKRKKKGSDGTSDRTSSSSGGRRGAAPRRQTTVPAQSPHMNRVAHAACSTCSSSSESDDGDDFLTSEYYLTAMKNSAAALSPAPRRAGSGVRISYTSNGNNSAVKGKSGKLKAGNSNNSNCIVS